MRKSKPIPFTQEYLKSILGYDPETGILRWKINRAGGVKIGDIAGWVSGTGYRCLYIMGGYYKAHRIIWLYVYGFEPRKYIDHINRIKLDNRISNLREAESCQNSFNIARSKSNTSGHKGVSWAKNVYKWKVAIHVNRKPKHLGYWSDLELAAFIYDEASRKYHGEFSYAKSI